MNKLMLTLALLSSIGSAYATIIEDAIKDSDLETLRIIASVGTTHNHSFKVTKDQKATYVQLAQEKVEKCKETSSSSFSLSALTSLDWISITAFAALTVSSGILVFDSIRTDIDPAQNSKYWRKVSGFGSGLLYGVGGALRSLKDLMKHSTEANCKAKEALKKAEKVLTLVEALPVEA